METTKKKSSRRVAKEMFPMVESYLRGSAGKSKFCQKRGINIHTFTYWQQKYNAAQAITKEKSGDSSKLISLELCPPPGSEKFEMCYPNGVRLRLPAGTSLSILQSLLQLRV
jgi:hypothetical protein